MAHASSPAAPAAETPPVSDAPGVSGEPAASGISRVSAVPAASGISRVSADPASAALLFEPGASSASGGADPFPRAVWISSVNAPMCKFAHKSSTQATDTYAVHSHPFHEILYIITGDVEMMIDDHPFRIREHTLVAFPPGLRHGVLVGGDRPYERFSLHFDAGCLSMERRALLEEVMPQAGFDSDLPRGESCLWRGMEHSGVLQCLEVMETLRLSAEGTAEMLMPIYIEAVLATLYASRQKRCGAVPREHRPTTVQKELVFWVEQHFTEPITLESLSERFYLSRGYVNTLFRSATGSTVKAYIQKRRMSYVQMLLSSGLSAAQAAARAGFEDYTTFYRAYLRAFGHPPSAAQRSAVRNDLLAETLSGRAASPLFPVGEVVFPEDGTEQEDPSMRNAVRMPSGPVPDQSYYPQNEGGNT